MHDAGGSGNTIHMYMCCHFGFNDPNPIVLMFRADAPSLPPRPIHLGPMELRPDAPSLQAFTSGVQSSQASLIPSTDTDIEPMQLGPFSVPTSRARCRLMPMELTLLHQLLTAINNRLLLGRGSLHGPRDYLAAAWWTSCNYVAQAMASFDEPLASVGHRTLDEILPGLQHPHLMSPLAPADGPSDEPSSEHGMPQGHPDTGIADAHPPTAPHGTLMGLLGRRVAGSTGASSSPLAAPEGDDSIPGQEPNGDSSSSVNGSGVLQSEEPDQTDPPQKRRRGG